jgi:hypothetical protein
VGTHADYRRRGLVRMQFEVIHQWSRERGQALQGITGIPNYYRQFGYEMCLNLGGGRISAERDLPKLAQGEPEPFKLRKAVVRDIPEFLRIYNLGKKRSLISAEWNEDLLRHEMLDKSPNNVNRRTPVIIETLQGRAVGILALPGMLWDQDMAITFYELDSSVSWQQVTPTVARWVMEMGKELAKMSSKECSGVAFSLGADHPAYTVAQNYLTRERRPYSWYIRVEDLPAFIRLVAPVLEKRLAASACSGFSGEQIWSFYRSGLKVSFENGKIAAVENYRPNPAVEDSAGFPGLTFLHLLMGYRSLEELQFIFPDCWAKPDTRVLLNGLFQKLN